MSKKVLALLMVVAVAGVALGSLWLMAPRDADASGHSAMRSFSPMSVDPGDMVTVTIRAENYGGLGRIVETVPSGFSNPQTSESGGSVSGQTVTFRLLAEGPLTRSYTVTAPPDPASCTDDPDSCTFSGTLSDEGRETESIGGADTVTITAPPPTPDTEPSATRSFSPTSVDPGDTVTVTIRAENYGDLGRIVETVPSGFSNPQTSESGGSVSGQTVTFRLLVEGPLTRSYTVTAPTDPASCTDDPDSCTFSGTLSDEGRETESIGGADTVTITAPPGPSARRSFSPSSVAPGDTVTVTIRAENYGGLGRIVETVPSSFSNPQTSESGGSVSGQTVTFRLLVEGPLTRSYTVTAPTDPASCTDDPASCTFSGDLESEDKSETQVGGSSRVTVRVVAPEPDPEPQVNRAPVFTDGTATTRSIDENSESGASVGAAVRATDADRDRLTYSLRGTDAGSFTINSSGQIMVGTGTMLDYETKDSYTVTARATDGSASDTISVAITVVNVDEDGVVTIMPDTTPQVGTELTASLEDQDGSVANLMWQWQKDDGQGSYVDIPGAMMMSYTPVMADEDSRLQATAMYDDSFGEDKTAMMATANPVAVIGSAVDRYDANDDGSIQKMEYLAALNDYLDLIIEKPAQLEVLDALIDFMGS